MYNERLVIGSVIPSLFEETWELLRIPYGLWDFVDFHGKM